MALGHSEGTVTKRSEDFGDGALRGRLQGGHERKPSSGPGILCA